jgi:hypothetical protein
MTEENKKEKKNSLKEQLNHIESLGFWNGAGGAFIVFSITGYGYVYGSGLDQMEFLNVGLIAGAFLIAIGISLRKKRSEQP